MKRGGRKGNSGHPPISRIKGGNMKKEQLKEIEINLEKLSDEVFLLRTGHRDYNAAKFREEILGPLKSITAYMENMEFELRHQYNHFHPMKYYY